MKLTVGKLKEIIKDLDDNMELSVAYEDENPIVDGSWLMVEGVLIYKAFTEDGIVEGLTFTRT